MKKLAFLSFMFGLTVWSGVAAAQANKVPKEVWQKAQTKGSVSVIVSLDVPVKPVRQLSKQDVIAQQERITAVQNQLITELEGTTYEVTGRFTMSSGMVLTVGVDALPILERSDLVKKVTENISMSPS